MSTALALQVTTLGALAARVLHWPPDVFWQATPAELAMALGLSTTQSPVPFSAPLDGIDRQTLQRLMDQEHER